MKLVSLFMDVEDPVNPQADDAALDFALLFSELGVRGSFCLTGEKCRTLVARNRNDVLDAFSGHCLGLHTDTHSIHPTTMELLEDLDYSSGCTAALAAETKGATAFEQALGRTPSFWGGAGNTWAPEIPQALVNLGIPAYCYALTELPGKPVHRFNSCFALPQHISVSEEAVVRAPDVLESTLGQIAGIDQPWVGVFVGHPTRHRYPRFWDRDYAGGANPTSLTAMPPIPNRQYEKAKDAMRGLIRGILGKHKVVGVDELLAKPMRLDEPSRDDINYFRVATVANLRGAASWPIHRSKLNPQNIISKTLALSETLEVCVLAV